MYGSDAGQPARSLYTKGLPPLCDRCMVVEGSIGHWEELYYIYIYIYPTEACAWVNLTQVQLNGREVTTVISFWGWVAKIATCSQPYLAVYSF